MTNTYSGATLTPADVEQQLDALALALWVGGWAAFWTAFIALDVDSSRRGRSLSKLAKHLCRLNHHDPKIRRRGVAVFTGVYVAGSAALYRHLIGERR